MNFKFEFDKFSSISLMIISAILGCYSIFNQVSFLFPILAIFIFIPSLFWTYHQNTNGEPLSSLIYSNNNKIQIKLTFALFFLFLTGLILVSRWEDDDYRRSTLFFIILLVIISICSYQIFNYKTFSKGLLLFEIIIIALIINISQIQLFPGVLYSDGWFHQKFISTILDSGNIPTFSQYSNIPIYHILIADTMLVNDLDIKTASIFSISFVQSVICVIVSYLIAKTIIKNSTLSLLTPLFFALGNIQIMMNVAMVPNTLASCFFILIIFILIKYNYNITTSWILIAIIISLAIVITHALAAAMVLIVLIGFLLANIIYGKMLLKGTKTSKSFITNFSFIFLCITISWWAYQSNQITYLREIIFSEFSLNNVSLERFSAIGVVENRIGIFAFFSMSLIGVYYSLSNIAYKKLTIYAYGALAITAVGILPMFIGVDVLGSRFWYFGQIMMSVPLAIALILTLGKGGHLRITLSIFLIIILSITQIMVPPGSIDNPLNIESEPTLSLSSSNIYTIRYVQELDVGNFSVDGYTYACFWRLDSNVHNAERLLITHNETLNMPDVLIIRDVDWQRDESLIKMGQWNYSILYTNDMTYLLSK